MGQTDKDDLIRLIDEDDAAVEIPTILPLLPVRDVVIFSDMLLPLFIGREKSIRAVEESVSKDGYLLLATQKDPTIEDPATDEKDHQAAQGAHQRLNELSSEKAVTEAAIDKGKKIGV